MYKVVSVVDSAVVAADVSQGGGELCAAQPFPHAVVTVFETPPPCCDPGLFLLFLQGLDFALNPVKYAILVG